MGHMSRMLIIMTIISAGSLLIVSLWNSVPIIKESVNAVLNPSFGKLLTWNLTYGMLIIIFLISLLTMLVQKYTTDQNAINELKKEQKELQKEVQRFKHDPQKMMEINKKNMQKNLEITGKIMSLSMKASIFTIVPFILLFRWFMDFFTALENPKFFGFLSWFWFYLIFVIVFSSVLRKFMKVA